MFNVYIAVGVFAFGMGVLQALDMIQSITGYLCAIIWFIASGVAFGYGV